MSRTSRIALGATGTLAILLVAGFFILDRLAYGLPGFYLWRSVTSEFHGAHRANVNGISLYYETYGAGPPVFVLHGAGAFLETMHHFIRALAPKHTVYAIDSRAQGRSTDSATPLTYAQMGDDMIKLMDALHLKQVDVVGWSDGGIDGLDMAMKHPDRVRRLMAIGANYDAKGIDPVTPQQLAEYTSEIEPFYRMIAPDPSHFPVLVKKVTNMIETEPHYTTAELSHIRARTLIVVGEHDAILPAHTKSLAAAIPGARLVILPGASHAGPLEQPDVYNHLAESFLDAP